MYSDGPDLVQLPRHECLRLLASVPAGRVIYTRRALPAVDLVNFGLHRGEVVIRTDRGGALAAASRGAVLAFEADWLDPARARGWSVTVIGPSREVADPEELSRLRAMGLTCWAPVTREQFITISPEIVTGRRLTAAGEPGSAPGRNGHVRLAT